MSIGIIGTTRPADVNVSDIDMYYDYTPNRQTPAGAIVKITNSSEFLSTTTYDEGIAGYSENLLEGLYDLKLPASVFSQLGIYTIYFKPKLIPTVVVDCSVLSALPTVKGIVIDMNSMPENLKANNSLQGYRIEYVNSDGTKLRNVVRYIVTSNKVSAINENVGNTTQKAIRYRFDDAGTLIFLQVTPSSASDVKPNSLPFIGNIGQTILMSNTYFSPLVVEVEMVENTINTLAGYIAGEQIKDVENGILTYYDTDRVITKQFNLFSIKDDTTDVPMYEVKEKRATIDESQNFDQIISGI